MRDSSDINHAYEILELTPGASPAQVKQAYRKLVKIWHPDRFTEEKKKQEAEEKIKKINAAYNKLKYESPIPENPSSSFPTNPTKISVSRWDAETFYNSGVENANARRYDEAITDFTHAIHLNPLYINAYKYRGLICSQLGYEYRATSDLNKAAQIEQSLKTQRTVYASTRKPVSKPKNFVERLCHQIKVLLKMN
jgi:tetratricopeptide (TPR) repeat protein